MNTRILKGIGLSVALSLAVVLLLVATPVSAQTFTWDGGGTTDNWSDSGNWGGSAVSESGDAILVYDGTTRLNSVKDVNGGSGGYNIDNITFNSTAGAFVLSETSGGTGIDMLGVRDPSLTAAITNNSSNTQTIALKVIARGSPYTAGTEFNTAVGNINVTGVVASLEGAGIVKTGSGTLYLSGNNTYSGSTAINQGVVRISSNTALGTTAAGTTVDQSTNARLELTGGITVAEDITFVNTSSGLSTTLRNVSGDNEISGLVTLPGSIRVGSNGGSLEFSGGVSGSNTFFVVNSSGGTTSFTTNPIDIGTGTFYVDSGGLTTLAA